MAEKHDAPSTSTETATNLKGDNSAPKAIIKNVDMSEEMQQESVDIASAALEKYNIEKDIAAQIKKEFDRRHGPTWHVVVGKNFGSYVTHAHFQPSRLLNDEPEKGRLTLLGTLPTTWEQLKTAQLEPSANPSQSTAADRLPAIVRIEKLPFDSAEAFSLFSGGYIRRLDLVESTDIYSWFRGWLSGSDRTQADVKVNVICPATETHIRKYTKQESILVRETPELYQQIVLPYIESFPKQRTRWVDEILSGHSEQEKVLFSSEHFVILPDMKWDLHTVGSLYLVAITRSGELRSLRDLRSEHIPLLTSIRREAYRVVKEKWSIDSGGLRIYIHYQPSYYHFHVHIVNANYEGAGMGMAVGQAHLLEDVISLLEVAPNSLQQMTLTYGLGEMHGLYSAMKAVQSIEI